MHRVKSFPLSFFFQIVFMRLSLHKKQTIPVTSNFDDCSPAQKLLPVNTSDSPHDFFILTDKNLVNKYSRLNGLFWGVFFAVFQNSLMELSSEGLSGSWCENLPFINHLSYILCPHSPNSSYWDPQPNYLLALESLS